MVNQARMSSRRRCRVRPSWASCQRPGTQAARRGQYSPGVDSMRVRRKRGPYCAAYDPAARWAEALQLAVARRARRHSHPRRRQAPPSPMSCSTRTRRSPDEPHRRRSVSAADEHAHPTTQSPTGSATTRLPSRTPKHVAVPDTRTTSLRSPHSLEGPASQIRPMRTNVRILAVTREQLLHHPIGEIGRGPMRVRRYASDSGRATPCVGRSLRTSAPTRL